MTIMFRSGVFGKVYTKSLVFRITVNFITTCISSIGIFICSTLLQYSYEKSSYVPNSATILVHLAQIQELFKTKESVNDQLVGYI